MLTVKLKSLVFTLLLFGFFCSSPRAATVIVEDGQLMGADDVDVNGVLYDVRFVEDSVIGLFYNLTDGTWNFDFDASGAVKATNALVDQVYKTNGVWNEFTASPGLTFGIDIGYNQMRVMTPYSSTHSQMVYMYEGYMPYGINQSYAGADTTSQAGYVWADWTVSAVPIPGSFTFLGLGILGLAGILRKK